MAQDEHEMLELLSFELKFLENGGYGRSPRTPWRPPFIFEDSPSCLNLGDHWATRRAAAQTRVHPCSECLLMKFVPEELQNETSPCRFIPLNEKGETIDYFYRCGTQLDLEQTLVGWLRKQVSRLEEQRKSAFLSHESGKTSRRCPITMQTMTDRMAMMPDPMDMHKKTGATTKKDKGMVDDQKK